MWGLSSVRATGIALMAALVTACGGGGSAGDSVFGGGSSGGTSTISSLKLVTTNANGSPISSVSNGGTETVTVRVTAVDSSNRVVAGAQVDFSVDNDAVVAPAATVTDDQGVITAQVGIGTNRSNRQVNITASANSGAVVARGQFLVKGADLSATAPPVVAPGASVTVEYTLVDGSQNPMAGETVTLTAGSVAVGTATTNSSGKASFTFNASTTVGSMPLSATAAGALDERIVQVQSTAVPNAVGTITSASVSANPSVVGVNTTGSTNAASVTALFKGANNANIANVRVWFTLPDPNSVGGTISNSGLVYSDSTGRATTSYIPGANFSPTDGVVILACYSNVDFTVPATAGSCPATDSAGNAIRSARATLTVVDDALRVSIGTDELVSEGTGTYRKDFVVTVVDSRNAAKSDVEVTPKLDLTGFYKGEFRWNGNRWSRDPLSGGGVLYGNSDGSVCPNEDLDRNGSESAGEDTNHNGELDPAGVSISIVGSSKTDSSGKVILRIEYPRDRATWIDFEITATARVSGSEGVAIYRGKQTGLGNLRAPGTAFTTEDITPAFAISPYGRSIGCDNTN